MGHEQRARVGVADVLGREDEHAPSDELRVLAAVDHAREPVDGGVGIASAHRLDEGADDVVVHVAGLVVGQDPGGARLPHGVECDRSQPVGAGLRPRRRELKRRQCDARIPAGGQCDRGLRLVVERDGPAEARVRPPALVAAASRTSSSDSVVSSMMRERLTSGALTSKNGFSVVAPMSTTIRSSTA